MNTASLILSKPLEGKREVLDFYIKNNIKEGKMILFVLTDKNPEQVKQELLRERIFFKNLYFVDSYSQQTGEVHKDTENVKYIPGPLALNELSIAISEFSREFIRKKLGYIIIFDSLSTLLIYSNAEAIARFLQILIAKIKNFNGNVLFTLEEGMHDQQTIITIEHLIDSIIEIRKENNRVLVRIKEKDKIKDWTDLNNISL